MRAGWARRTLRPLAKPGGASYPEAAGLSAHTGSVTASRVGLRPRAAAMSGHAPRGIPNGGVSGVSFIYREEQRDSMHPAGAPAGAQGCQVKPPGSASALVRQEGAPGTGPNSADRGSRSEGVVHRPGSGRGVGEGWGQGFQSSLTLGPAQDMSLEASNTLSTHLVHDRGACCIGAGCSDHCQGHRGCLVRALGSLSRGPCSAVRCTEVSTGLNSPM